MSVCNYVNERNIHSQYGVDDISKYAQLLERSSVSLMQFSDFIQDAANNGARELYKF
jgi:hypothetical protein